MTPYIPNPRGLPLRFPKALYAAAFAAGVSDTLLVFYLPLHLHRDLHERHLLVVGLVVALPQMGVFLASNFWGALGDQWRRLKPLLLVSMLGIAAMLLALARARSSGAVMVAVLVGSLFYAAYKPGAYSFATLREPARKGHALAAVMRAQSLGWFVGNLFCGTMLGHYGSRAMSWVLAYASGLAAMTAIAVALRMPELARTEFEAHRLPEGEKTGEMEDAEIDAEVDGKPAAGGFLRDLAALYETRMLVWVCLVWLFTTSGRWLFFTFFSILYTEHIHGSVQVVSLASACSALAGIFFYGFAGQWVDRFGARKVLLMSVLGYGAYFFINIFLSQPYLVAALFVLPFYPTFSVSGSALAAAVVPRGQRAGSMGVITGTDALGALCGSLAGGWAGDRWGVGVTPMAAAALAGVAFMLAFSTLRKAPLAPPALAARPGTAP